MTNEAYVCWTEIPVTDLAKAQDFYQDVFGWTMVKREMEPNDIVDFTSDGTAVAGHLYPGKPAAEGTGSTIHLVVPDQLEATMERCAKKGGSVVSPIIEIPPGRFAYAVDLDGNSIGLFEPNPA